jgi:uncharacterized membrane protein YkoI
MKKAVTRLLSVSARFSRVDPTTRTSDRPARSSGTASMRAGSKELLSQTKITLAQAVAAAKKAQTGQLGQVDLERYGGRIVYMVDVGDREVRVDATDGSIAAISQQD